MTKHPIPSVAESLVPDSLVDVWIFCVHRELEERPGAVPGYIKEIQDQISEWVLDTGNLIVMPGAVNITDKDVSLAVTYVRAASHGQKEIRKAEEHVREAARPDANKGSQADADRGDKQADKPSGGGGDSGSKPGGGLKVPDLP